jgi:hypothetical protein
MDDPHQVDLGTEPLHECREVGDDRVPMSLGDVTVRIDDRHAVDPIHLAADRRQGADESVVVHGEHGHPNPLIGRGRREAGVGMIGHRISIVNTRLAARQSDECESQHYREVWEAPACYAGWRACPKSS